MILIENGFKVVGDVSGKGSCVINPGPINFEFFDIISFAANNSR